MKVAFKIGHPTRDRIGHFFPLGDHPAAKVASSALGILVDTFQNFYLFLAMFTNSYFSNKTQFCIPLFKTTIVQFIFVGHG